VSISVQKPVDIRVVVADPVSAARTSLCRLVVDSWGWDVVADTGDAFRAVGDARRLRADLLLVDAGLEGLPLREIRSLLESSGTLVIALLERPEQHAGPRGPSVLKSVPSDLLRDRIMEHLEAHWAQRFPSIVAPT